MLLFFIKSREKCGHKKQSFLNVGKVNGSAEANKSHKC
ncbi:hypothetical protein NT05HA_0644 [Aggregatibacter aphrophilus NJ8700]|nr:hypothetical protein NT05HA_0644 [Aggregatibacter aphrophilus NJ8700]